MRRTALLLLALLWPLCALAQGGPVLQSGMVTPGHVAIWGANGVIYDGGGALGGSVGANPFEIGITNTGTPFCITDVPTTSPYHQLCLGANTLLGYGVLSYNAYGGAPPLPFDCIINGAFIPNCFGSGSGTVQNISITANPCIVATPNPITTTGVISTIVPFVVACGGTGQTSFTASNPILGNGINALSQGTRSGNTTEFGTVLGSTTSGDCVKFDASGNLVDAGSGCLGLNITQTVPAELLVNGSSSANCTTSPCTFAITDATQLANTVWAGPTSGGAAIPTFRAIGCTDLPFGRCPWDPYSFMPGVPANNAIIRYVSVSNVSCPANLAGSFAIAKEASTGTAVVNINHIVSGSPTTVGTVTFTASATGVFGSASAFTMTAGDLLEEAYPSSADATLGDIAITLKCTRTS